MSSLEDVFLRIAKDAEADEARLRNPEPDTQKPNPQNPKNETRNPKLEA